MRLQTKNEKILISILAAIPIAAWTGVLTVAMLLAAALAAGTSSMFFSLALNAYLPHLLTSDDRLEGNARLQTSAQAAQVAGPGLGGLLAQLAGPVCGLLADALTFLVSAACLLSLRARPEPRSAQASRPRDGMACSPLSQFVTERMRQAGGFCHVVHMYWVPTPSSAST